VLAVPFGAEDCPWAEFKLVNVGQPSLFDPIGDERGRNALALLIKREVKSLS
jgi:hypothetical protein